MYNSATLPAWQGMDLGGQDSIAGTKQQEELETQ